MVGRKIFRLRYALEARSGAFSRRRACAFSSAWTERSTEALCANVYIYHLVVMVLCDDSIIRNFTHLRGSYHP
jgi:hypothetical protein